MLLTYFGHLPAARARLADAYAATLGRVPDGAPKQAGVRYGERAADRVIALRADDGRSAPLGFAMAPAPGVWRPTPPANAPFFAPWLARTRPLLLTSDGATIDWGAYNAAPAPGASPATRTARSATAGPAGPPGSGRRGRPP